MGRTVLPQRNIIEIRLEELRRFRHALRKDDRELLDRLLTAPSHYISAITCANSLDSMDYILLCMLLMQQKEIERQKGLNTPLIRKEAER